MARPGPVGSRVAALGSGFMDAFVRGNRVLTFTLALLALFVCAWLLAGVFMNGSDQEQVAHRAELAQSDDTPGRDPAAPEIENRDVDSYAAYRSKDPFRQILAPAPSEQTTPEGTTEQTTPEDTAGTTPGAPPGNGGGGARAADADNDGVPNRRERALGLDPRNPDTDGDGTPDGADDANGDGRPDGGAGNGAGNSGAPSSPDRGDGRRPGRGGDLLDSGGIMYPR